MNTQYGTLVIRREIAMPVRWSTGDIRYRHVTLATYRRVPQSECSDLIDRFCEANNIPRLNLHCEWKFSELL